MTAPSSVRLAAADLFAARELVTIAIDALSEQPERVGFTYALSAVAGELTGLIAELDA